ncbi:MAG: hypothetical protein WC975_00760 [Phycisphaerae bacterium]
MSNLQRFHTLEFVFMMILSGILICPAYAEETQVAVTINCADTYSWISLAGFLHGHYVATDDQIRRLSVGYWRDPPIERFPKMKQLGIEASIGFAYLVKEGKDYNARMVTAENSAAYVRYIKDRYNAVSEAEKKYNYRVKYWEFWNEPEGMYVWEPQTKGKPDVKMERLFYAFKIFYDTMRELKPDALIVAPSSCHFWPELMEDFIKRCNENKIRLDAIAWHVIDCQPHEIPKQVEFVRRLIKKYPSIGVKEIHLNEFGWPNIGAGSQMGYFYYMGKSRVDLATKSIWGYEPIDNLITSEGVPRVSYWAWEYYGKISPKGFDVKSNNPFVVGLAGTDKKNRDTIRIILARTTVAKRYSSDPGPPIPAIPPIASPVNVSLLVMNMPDGKKSIEIVSLPNTDYSLSEDVRKSFISQTEQVAANGKILLAFPHMEEEKVFLVTIQPAEKN